MKKKNILGEYSSFFSFQVGETIYTSKELAYIGTTLYQNDRYPGNRLPNEELVRTHRPAKSINGNFDVSFILKTDMSTLYWILSLLCRLEQLFTLN